MKDNAKNETDNWQKKTITMTNCGMYSTYDDIDKWKYCKSGKKEARRDYKKKKTHR